MILLLLGTSISWTIPCSQSRKWANSLISLNFPSLDQTCTFILLIPFNDWYPRGSQVKQENTNCPHILQSRASIILINSNPHKTPVHLLLRWYLVLLNIYPAPHTAPSTYPSGSGDHPDPSPAAAVALTARRTP